MSKLTQVVTGKCRASYVFLNEPKVNDKGDEKYEVSIIISKDDEATIDKVRAAIEAAKNEGKTSKWGGKIPRGNSLKLPLHDGDDKDDDTGAYENSYYLTARSRTRPVIMDRNRNLIADEDEIYSGMYCAFILNLYPYNNESKGVAVGLEAVMKISDGERLGGGRMSMDSVVDAFADFDFGDEDGEEDNGGGFF